MATLVLRVGEIKDEWYDKIEFHDVQLDHINDDIDTSADTIIYSDMGKCRFIKGGEEYKPVTTFLLPEIFEYI